MFYQGRRLCSGLANVWTNAKLIREVIERINFNISTKKPQSLLEQIQQRQDKLSEKLASGKQINSAADGAAAQQTIDRLTSEVEGGRQAPKLAPIYKLIFGTRAVLTAWIILEPCLIMPARSYSVPTT